MSIFDKLFRRGVSKAPLVNATQLSGRDAIPDQYLPFWELQKNRQLLEVKIGSATRSYQSMVLALDIDRGLLWLDDLFPQQLFLEAGDYITLRHHKNNEQLVVRAPVVALGSDYGATGFAIELPEHAAYAPRRAYPRYAMGHHSPFSVKIRTLGQEPCFGTVQDISSGGLRLMVAGNLLQHLRHGATLPLCEVNLGEDLQIRCRARICAFRLGRSPYRHTQICVEFIDLSDEKRAAVGVFLRNANFPLAGEDELLRQEKPAPVIARSAA